LRPPGDAVSPTEKREQKSPAKIELTAGDRAFQIGQVFGNVIIQILSPKAALIIVVALALGAIGAYLLYSRAQLPDRMTGDFNVAVAQFGGGTDQGNDSGGIGERVSRLVVRCLDLRYDRTDFGLNPETEHDEVGTITEKRDAAKVARIMGADVVLFGSVHDYGEEVELYPMFYVADQPDTGELTGEHGLALPIRFRESEMDDVEAVSSVDDVEGASRDVCSRTDILVKVTGALIFRSGGNLGAAYDLIQEAINEAEGQDQFDGQEMLYLVAAVINRLQGDYEAAAENLDKALELNPNYARAYIGLGNIHYAQFDFEKRPDEALLDKAQTNYEEALEAYKRALEAGEHPQGAHIIEKANVSIGNVYYRRGRLANDAKLFAKAVDHYELAVAEYEKTEPEEFRGPIAQAYFSTGKAYEKQKDYAQAALAYRRSVFLADNTKLRLNALAHYIRMTFGSGFQFVLEFAGGLLALSWPSIEIREESR
jgi:tetratricopeptide (TPR) repeat protein